MATVFYANKILVICLLMLLLMLHAVSPSTSSGSSSKFSRRGAVRQLTPSQCQMAKTQCPTLTGQASHLGLDPQLLFLRAQYENSLRRMKVYFQHIIDILIQQPTASPLLTLCANMGDDAWMFSPTTSRTTSAQATKPSPSLRFSTNSTMPTKQGPESTVTKSTTTSTVPSRTSRPTTMPTTTPTSPRWRSTSQRSSQSPTAATSPKTTIHRRTSGGFSTSPDPGRAQGSEEPPERVAETEPPSTSFSSPPSSSSTSTRLLASESSPSALTKLRTSSGTYMTVEAATTPESDTSTGIVTNSVTPSPQTKKSTISTANTTPRPTTRSDTKTTVLTTVLTTSTSTAGAATPRPGTALPTAETETTQTVRRTQATTQITTPTGATTETRFNPHTTVTDLPATMSVAPETSTEMKAKPSPTKLTATTREPITSKKTTTMKPETTTEMTAATTESSSTSPTATTSASALCSVSSWSQWSVPVGFGVQVRERSILTPGLTCPQGDRLLETRPFVQLAGGISFHKNVSRVADNFRDSFLRRTDGARDILLIVDASGSVDVKEMTMIKEGLKRLTDLFCRGFGNGQSHNRLAIVQFSNDATAIHTFQKDQSPSALVLAVDKLYSMYGYTCTEKALELARLLFQTEYGARDDVDHDTLLMTDGHSNCEEEAVVLNSSQALQNVSNVFAVAIGLQEDSMEDTRQAQKEILSLVSGQDPRRVFSLEDFRDFQQMTLSVQGRYDVNEDCPGTSAGDEGV